MVKTCWYCKQLVNVGEVVAYACFWRKAKRIAETPYHVQCAVDRSLKRKVSVKFNEDQRDVRARLRAKIRYNKKLDRPEMVEKLELELAGMKKS